MEKLYKHKSIDYGFVVLCNTDDISHIKTTIDSIKHNYPGKKYLCILPSSTSDESFKRINKLSALIKAEKDSESAILNKGLSNLPCKQWNFIIKSNVWLHPNLDNKYSYFIENEQDILFPLVKRDNSFLEGSRNGFLIHNGVFDNIPILNWFDAAKIIWQTKLIKKNYRFKAIYGNHFYKNLPI